MKSSDEMRRDRIGRQRSGPERTVAPQEPVAPLVDTKRLLIALALAANVLLTGCHKETEPRAKQVLPAANVQVVKAMAGKHVSFEQISGTVVPLVKSSLEAKVVGRVSEVAVQAGDAVNAGQTLVKIEAPEIQARVDRATAASKLAELEGKRVQNLFARQAATQSELDAATARVVQARAAVEEATVMLGYLTIAAPFDGVVSRKLTDLGDLAAPGKSLIEIEKPGGKRFEAAIPESLIARVKIGSQLELRIGDVPDPISVKATEINPAGDPVSRSWLVKFELPETVDVRSGAYGRVAVPRDEVNAVTVPTSAVLRRGQLEQVFVVAGGHATMRLVKTGRALDEKVEILSGLDDGEIIVLNPDASLVGGQPVNVQ